MPAKLKTSSNRLKTRRPTSKSMKTKVQLQEESDLQEAQEMEDAVLSKEDATAKPKLNPIWPVFMVTAILACIGIPFVPFAERILIGTLSGCFTLLSVFMIFRFEKNLNHWYIANPEFAPGKKKKRNVNKTNTSFKAKTKKRPALARR